MASLAVSRNRTEAAHGAVSVEVRRLDDALGPSREPISFIK
jgi:hypothetical protein